MATWRRQVLLAVVHTYIHTYACTYIRIHVHTYVHTYIHTYACTCVVTHLSVMCINLHCIIECTTWHDVHSGTYIVTCINTTWAVIRFMIRSHDTRVSGLASRPHVPHSHSGSIHLKGLSSLPQCQRATDSRCTYVRMYGCCVERTYCVCMVCVGLLCATV